MVWGLSYSMCVHLKQGKESSSKPRAHRQFPSAMMCQLNECQFELSSGFKWHHPRCSKSLCLFWSDSPQRFQNDHDAQISVLFQTTSVSVVLLQLLKLCASVSMCLHSVLERERVCHVSRDLVKHQPECPPIKWGFVCRICVTVTQIFKLACVAFDKLLLWEQKCFSLLLT